MGDTVSFGMGCFHFAAKGRLPFTFTGWEYMAEVRRVLESIPSIDNIAAYADEEFEACSQEVTEQLPRISDGTGCFPMPGFLDLRFEIYLPRRVQEDLLRERICWEPLAERYRVLITYGYEMPVAFVEPLVDEVYPWPADGVRVVREFLQNVVRADSSERVFFDFLGPTPFHADCYLRPGSKQENAAQKWQFKVEREPAAGYDQLLFRFNPAGFDDIQTARDELFQDLTGEISLFYAIHCGRRRAMGEWHEITTSLDDLISAQQTSGVRGHVKRLVHCPAAARELLLRVARFEGDDVLAHHAIRSERDELYAGRSDRLLEFYIQRAIDELGSYPAEQVTRSVDLIHSGGVKSRENMMLLLAALLSGAGGAILVNWLSR